MSACKEAIDSLEFARWRAYDRLEPIGNERFDYLFAYLMLIIYKVNAGRRQRPLKVKDFLIRWGPPEPLDWRKMKAWAAGVTREMGGKVKGSED